MTGLRFRILILHLHGPRTWSRRHGSVQRPPRRRKRGRGAQVAPQEARRNDPRPPGSARRVCYHPRAIAKHYKFSTLLKPAVRRALHPVHLSRSIKIARAARGEGKKRGAADERLKLFSQILPGGFLNYGYHEDPAVAPEELSLADLRRAQQRYAARMLSHLEGVTGPVLDVGCGMGGLLLELARLGFDATGVTPDEIQIEHLRRDHPELRLVHSKFEKLDRDEYRGRIGAVVNAESLQYLRLRKTMKVLDAILAPDGRWIVCDYFRDTEGEHGGGHLYADFKEHIAGRFRIRSEEDITPHVRPTWAFVHMWGTRLGLPLFAMLAADLQRKRPGTAYLMEESLRLVGETAREVVEITNPDTFAAGGRYLLMELERA